jgi:hypothetical protein
VYPVPEDGLIPRGLASLNKNLRDSLMAGSYYSCDIVAAHPTFFVELARVYKVAVPTWKAYVEDPRSFRNEFNLCTGVGEARSKEYFNAKLNGRKDSTLEREWKMYNQTPPVTIVSLYPEADLLDKELNSVMTLVLRDYRLSVMQNHDYVSALLTEGGNNSTPLSPAKICNLIYEAMEKTCLDMMVGVLVREGHVPEPYPIVLLHDGLFFHKDCLKDSPYKNDLAQLKAALQTVVKMGTNIPIKLKVESVEDPLGIDSTQPSELHYMFEEFSLYKSFPGVWNEQCNQHVDIPLIDERLLVIESMTNTGKTYGFGKWFVQLRDHYQTWGRANSMSNPLKFVSLTHLISLSRSQVDSFAKAGVGRVQLYLDEKNEIGFPKPGRGVYDVEADAYVDDSIQGSICCVNSVARLRKWATETNSDKSSVMMNTVVYIDEVSSFVANLVSNQTVLRDSRDIVDNLHTLLKSAYKVVIADALVTSTVYRFLRQLMFRGFYNETDVYLLRNTFKSFAGVPLQVTDSPDSFYDMLKDAVGRNEYFLCAFDTKADCERFAYSLFLRNGDSGLLEADELPVVLQDKEVAAALAEAGKDGGSRLCKKLVMLTSLSKVDFKNPSEEWAEKFVLYSPTITVGVDFNIDRPQRQFSYVTGRSLDALGLLQQVCRTRNQSGLTICLRHKQDLHLEVSSRPLTRCQTYPNAAETLSRTHPLCSSSTFTAFADAVLENSHVQENIGSNNGEFVLKLQTYSNLLSRAGFDIGGFGHELIKGSKTSARHKTMNDSRLTVNQMLFRYAIAETKREAGLPVDGDIITTTTAFFSRPDTDKTLGKAYIDLVKTFRLHQIDLDHPGYDDLAYDLVTSDRRRNEFFMYARIVQPWSSIKLDESIAKHDKQFFRTSGSARARCLYHIERELSIPAISRFDEDSWGQIRVDTQGPRFNEVLGKAVRAHSHISTTTGVAAYDGFSFGKARLGNLIVSAFAKPVRVGKKRKQEDPEDMFRSTTLPLRDIYPAMLSNLLPDVVREDSKLGWIVVPESRPRTAFYRVVADNMGITTARFSIVPQILKLRLAGGSRMMSRSAAEWPLLLDFWEKITMPHIFRSKSLNDEIVPAIVQIEQQLRLDMAVFTEVGTATAAAVSVTEPPNFWTSLTLLEFVIQVLIFLVVTRQTISWSRFQMTYTPCSLLRGTQENTGKSSRWTLGSCDSSALETRNASAYRNGTCATSSTRFRGQLVARNSIGSISDQNSTGQLVAKVV